MVSAAALSGVWASLVAGHAAAAATVTVTASSTGRWRSRVMAGTADGGDRAGDVGGARGLLSSGGGTFRPAGAQRQDQRGENLLVGGDAGFLEGDVGGEEGIERAFELGGRPVLDRIRPGRGRFAPRASGVGPAARLEEAEQLAGDS